MPEESAHLPLASGAVSFVALTLVHFVPFLPYDHGVDWSNLGHTRKKNLTAPARGDHTLSRMPRFNARALFR